MNGKRKKQKPPPRAQTRNKELNIKQNDNLTQFQESEVSGSHESRDTKANNLRLTFIERLNKYSNLIVGVATVLLVFVTSIYIYLSWQIATETKRLADISIEQFKIRSYPTFLILRTNPTYIDGKFKDEIKIQNKGEISSHETSFLIIYALMTQEPNQPKRLSFLSDWTYVYRDKESENIEILDYSKNILPNSGTSIGIENPVPDVIVNNLKFQFIFIRHKVPYDSKYSYEAHAFAWEARKSHDNSNENLFHWETLPNSRKDSLLGSLFSSEIIAPNREIKITEFFKDYHSDSSLKFHVKK